MITNRTLMTWRRDALKELSLIRELKIEDFKVSKSIKDSNERILRLTQELQDINLLKVIK